MAFFEGTISLDVHDPHNPVLGEECRESDVSEIVQSNKRTYDKVEDDTSIDVVNGVFLRSSYPLDASMAKNITIGIFEALDYQPGVLLNHYGKNVLFTKENWDEFNSRIDVIGGNLLANKNGKNTRVLLRNSDIEVDNMKIYGKQYIRIKDGSKHSDKVLLTKDEFLMLQAVMSPASRYISQLESIEGIIKDYILSRIQKPNSESVFVSKLVDDYIINRLPQEVTAHLHIKTLQIDETYEDAV